MEKKVFVQFGAGNIGRSFMGRVFGSAGYEVVFVDINRAVIDTLNRDHQYRVVIKKNTVADREITISNVQGIYSNDREAVVSAICSADTMATSVGKNVLPLIAPSVAAGLLERFGRSPHTPLNIILAENIHNGAAFFAGELRKHLPEEFPLKAYVGLIETSIGKMVPIMPRSIVEENPTIVFSEEYNTLILDRQAFIGQVPDIEAVMAVDNIAAYVDRKLCIHNLGHAAVSYLGNRSMPEAIYLYEVLRTPEIVTHVRATMLQSAAGLLAEYPDVFTHTDLVNHIDDLLERFQNVALGDTIFRVGRDLPRKLYRDDRVLGAARLCVKHNLPCDTILDVFMAGLEFRAADESGERYPDDLQMLGNYREHGLEWILEHSCKLAADDAVDALIVDALKRRV